MIGSLTGTISIINQNLLLHTQGVGYLVHVSNRLLQRLSQLQAAQVKADPKAKQNTTELSQISETGYTAPHTVTIYTYTHVREESLDLYGFESWAERTLFIMFLSVSGVGPSTAIQILNHDIASISTAIQEANVSFFSAIPRIGKKMAQKIIIELGSKLGEVKSLEIGPQSVVFTELRDSLAALGFNPDAVSQVLVDLQKEHDFDTTKPGTIIKLAIAKLGKK